METQFNPYYKWLGVPPQEQPANHYRLLGLALFESDLEVIESAADRQMTHVRTFQTGRYSAQSQEVLNSLSSAKVCLLKPPQKAEYDEQLRAKLEAEKPSPLPQAPQLVPAIPVTWHSAPSTASNYTQLAPVQSHKAKLNRRQTPALPQAESAVPAKLPTQQPAKRIQIVAALVVLMFLVTGWFAWSRLNRRAEQRDTPEDLAKKTVEPAAAVVPKPDEELPEKPKPSPAVQPIVAPPAGIMAAVEPNKPQEPVENIPAMANPAAQPPVVASDGSVDFQVAEWILGKGGSVKVQTRHADRLEVKTRASMPQPPFVMKGIKIAPNLNFNEAELAILRQLPDLESVTLVGEFVDDHWLAALSQARHLRFLTLNGVSITDAGLLNLRNLTELETLDFTGARITDQGLSNLPTLGKLTRLTLRGTQITDTGLKHLALFPRLSSLYLDGTAITDAGLAHLAQLPELASPLSLDDTRINGSGLKYLHRRSRLTNISLQRTAINDDGLKELAGCENLTMVNLAECTSFTDAGLKHLQQLKQLDSLFLSRTKITDESLKHVQALPSLRMLGLTKTAISDEGLKCLVACPKLYYLILSECAVTDAGMKNLQGVEGLTSLYVGSTAVTDVGKRELKTALPSCKIYK